MGKHTHGYLNICDVQHKDPECLAPSQEVGSGFQPPGPQASSRCKVVNLGRLGIHLLLKTKDELKDRPV